jgi:hypothetical protein
MNTENLAIENLESIDTQQATVVVEFASEVSSLPLECFGLVGGGGAIPLD